MEKLKYLSSVLFEAFLLLLLSCCVESHDSRLVVADALMEDYPDSAYVILSEIRPDELPSEYDRAKFGLLKTQALIKIDSTVTDDSLINASVAYFIKDKSTAEYMKSLFYTAWIQNLKGDYYHSMINATEAYDLAISHNDDYWTAKCAELISFIFQSNYNCIEANKYSRKAAEAYKKTGRERNSHWCMMDNAKGYVSLQEYDSALNILSQLPVPDDSRDSVLLAEVLDIRQIIFFNRGEYSKADSVFGKRLKLNKYSPVGSMNYHIEVLTLTKLGRTVPAARYLHKGDSLIGDCQDTLTMKLAHSFHKASCGDYRTAFEMIDTIYGLNVKIENNAYRNEASLAQRDYYNKKSEDERIKAERRKIIVIAICLIATLFMIGVFVYYRMHLRMKNLEIADMANHIMLITKHLADRNTENEQLSVLIKEKDSKIEAFNRAKDGIMDVDDGRKELKNRVMSLFARDLRKLSTTCSELYSTTEEGNYQVLLKRIKGDLSNIRNPRHLKTIESLVNEYRNNIIAQARCDLKGLDNKSFMVLSLFYSGIDSGIISVVLDIKQNSIGPTKSRLRTKIEHCGSKNSQFYIDVLNEEVSKNNRE